MRAAFFAVAAIAGLAGAMPARAATDVDPAAARRAAAQEMLDACRDREQAVAYFDKLADMQILEARSQMRNVSEAQWREFETAFRDELSGKVDEYMALTVSIDATHFSVDDMKALSDFCRSPLGQKVSSLRAQIERETFDLRQAWLMNAVMAAGQHAMQKAMPGQPGGGL